MLSLGTEEVVMARPPDVASWMTTLYAFCEVPPPHPVTFMAKVWVAAVFGVPVKFSDVVVLDAFTVMPAGNVPDAIAHL